MSRAATEQVARRRRSDTNEETRELKLAIPAGLKETGYEYRWVNDTAGGRIHNLTKSDDWDIVNEPAIDGQGEGTPVKRFVGSNEHGQPLHAYLCRKPKEYFEEDRRKRLNAITEQESAMKRGPLPSADGIKPAEAYVPAGHTNRIGRGP